MFGPHNRGHSRNVSFVCRCLGDRETIIDCILCLWGQLPLVIEIQTPDQRAERAYCTNLLGKCGYHSSGCFLLVNLINEVISLPMSGGYNGQLFGLAWLNIA